MVAHIEKLKWPEIQRVRIPIHRPIGTNLHNPAQSCTIVGRTAQWSQDRSGDPEVGKTMHKQSILRKEYKLVNNDVVHNYRNEMGVLGHM